MMPFIMGLSFEECFLPEYLRDYYKYLIRTILFRPRKGIGLELGKICYLTINEGFVYDNQTPRKLGLHTESHTRREFQVEGGPDQEKSNETQIVSQGIGQSFIGVYDHHWLITWLPRLTLPGSLGVKGGIYEASNVAKLCAVWKS